MWCKENSKGGSANNSGFLAPTTATNRTSRGKQYGQGVGQRLRHFLHYKNKFLSCLPRCSPLFTYQAACTWQFRKLCTRASTESGLPPWNLWRFRTKVHAIFPYLPFFLNEGVTDAGPCAWLQSETTVTDTAGVAVTQSWEHLYTGSCLGNIHTLHFSTQTKKHSFIKMYMS